MKKQASTLLPALLDLLRQYLALDMAVYAGHATLLLLTASLPLLMWVLVIINMLPFYSVSDIAALVAQLLPDIPAIQSMAVDVIANLNNQSTTFMASFAAITTVISASGGMAAVQKGLQKLTPGARKTMFDRLWAVLYTFLFEGLMLVAMVVQSLSPILRGLAGLLPLHTLVGGLLQRLHSLLSRTAACKARRAVAMTAATVRPARTASLPPRARAQSRAAVQTTASAAVRMRPAMHSLHRPVPPERRAAAAAVPLLQGTKTRALCSSAVVRRSRSSRTLRSI